MSSAESSYFPCVMISFPREHLQNLRSMASSYILVTLMLYVGISVVQGGICGGEILHTIFDYQEQLVGIVAFIRTISVVPNFNTTSYCNSIETCTMYCEMTCRHHNCTVYAMRGDTCFVHNYDLSGEWNMITVDNVWFKKGLNIKKSK